MQLQLLIDEQWILSISVDSALHDALLVQCERGSHGNSQQEFVERLSECLSHSLAAFLDLDLQLPTSKQVRYATAIALELGLALPAEVLRYRGASFDFIHRFEDAFLMARRRSRHRGKR